MKTVDRTYAVCQIGEMRNWGQHQFEHAAFPNPIPGKTFARDTLGLTGVEVSFNHVPRGGAIPFYHRHRTNEELYVFLSGRGEMQVDGETIAVSEGSAVRVSPAGKRAWRNTGDGSLVFMVIQAKANTLHGSNISDGEIVPGEVTWKKTAA